MKPVVLPKYDASKTPHSEAFALQLATRVVAERTAHLLTDAHHMLGSRLTTKAVAGRLVFGLMAVGFHLSAYGIRWVVPFWQELPPAEYWREREVAQAILARLARMFDLMQNSDLYLLAETRGHLRA